MHVLLKENAFTQVLHMQTIFHPRNHGILLQLRLSLVNGDPSGATRPRLCITLILRELSSWSFPEAVVSWVQYSQSLDPTNTRIKKVQIHILTQLGLARSPSFDSLFCFWRLAGVCSSTFLLDFDLLSVFSLGIPVEKEWWEELFVRLIRSAETYTSIYNQSVICTKNN